METKFKFIMKVYRYNINSDVLNLDEVLLLTDFNFLYFKDTDLSASTFQANSFQNCVFINVNFYDTQLSEANFANCLFSFCDLTYSGIYNTHFNNVVFVTCRLAKLDSLETKFTNCTFVDCDFKFSDFSSAKFVGCKIIRPLNLTIISKNLNELIIIPSIV